MKTLLLVPAADCLILSHVCGPKRGDCTTTHKSWRARCSLMIYRRNGVERSVSSHAEVRSWDVVGDGGGDNDQGDAKLLVLLSGLHHLQTPDEGLRHKGRSFSRRREWTERPDVSDSHLEAPDDDDGVDVELCDGQADLLHHILRQRPSQKRSSKVSSSHSRSERR